MNESLKSWLQVSPPTRRAAEPALKLGGSQGAPTVPGVGGCGGGWRRAKTVPPQKTHHEEPRRSLAVGAGWLRDPDPSYFGTCRCRRWCGELSAASPRRGEQLLLRYFYPPPSLLL